jgi:hypothetical protein
MENISTRNFCITLLLILWNTLECWSVKYMASFWKETLAPGNNISALYCGGLSSVPSVVHCPVLHLLGILHPGTVICRNMFNIHICETVLHSAARSPLKTRVPGISLELSSPITGLDRPLSFQEIEVPRISRQSAHECGKFVSPKHRPLYPPGDNLKNTNDPIGNWTRDFPACNTVFQPL